ncbi:choice-of-anchor D domain-containing protein [Lutibacter sp. HS1-25]|uniref:LamG-like jellyroll fold domain-containing protein n=1 Tax=Lutibacter sp. HS1-25 TaxID=2485000 RepID=UPI0010123A15|nr:LamG-like jellyroll fold domain-containing protein [Lutibacter sp. HS1-25]RXP49318.1 choice-of-anchor D domain-containing protein [Lutibacter sp. HS1-25]
MKKKLFCIKIKLIPLLLVLLFPAINFSQTTIYTADFETLGDLDGWTQGEGDDFDWTQDSGGTPSGNTGPSTGASGSYYMYTEASNNLNNKSYFISPEFNLSGVSNPEFSFFYHMYGADMGTLSLNVSTDGGSTYATNLWSRSGSDIDQTNNAAPWKKVSIDLSAYVGQKIYLRFEGLTGNGYRSDMAIDKIVLTGVVPIVPDINVTGNGVSIVSGDTTPSLTDDTDFGSHSSISSVEKIFTIENIGYTDLEISNITISGTVFSVTSLISFPYTIVSGSSETFIITGTPTTTGVFQETITISNNDFDESSYQFDVKITGEQVFFDSDGDGIYDNVDIDDDNDGIKDEDEETSCRLSNVATTINYKFLNETFGEGTNRVEINTTYDASTTYCYEDGTGVACKLNPSDGNDLNDGEYTVYYKAANGDGINDTPNGEVAHWADAYWYTGADHTGGVNGRMAMFNASYDPGLFYSATIKGALPGVPVTYSFWVLNLDTQAAPGIATRLRPKILVEFRDVNNVLLESVSTDDLYPLGIPPSINGDPASSWHQITKDLTFNVDEFYVYFYNNETGGAGNDLAIDDIVISQTLCDTDSDRVADVFDLDSDNDGIPDVVEAGLGNLSAGTAKISYTTGWLDSNSNGMHDSAESNTPLDSDGDGVPNHMDLDSDNDAIFDVDESGATNPLAYVGYQNGDGDINGDGVGDGDDSDTVRETDINSDGDLDYFGDGILDIYDYFGTSLKGSGNFDFAYGNQSQGSPTGTGWFNFVVDSDNDGIPDYLDVMSNGADWDIDGTLYANLDTDNNGVIDVLTDTDGDGLSDSFDTDDAVFGSPRDLDRKLLLYFDGRNDYAEDVNVLSSGSGTIMAFVKSDGVNFTNTDRVIAGQDDFYIKIDNSTNKIVAVVEGNTITSTNPIINGNWTHIAVTTTAGKTIMYINGIPDNSDTNGGITDTSNFLIGSTSSHTNYFKGQIDEVRVFDKALTENELQKIVYQEIEDNGGVIKGSVVQLDVQDYVYNSTTGVETTTLLPWTNLQRYFRMDVYKDDIIDDLTTLDVDEGAGSFARIYNMKIIDVQTAPLPFITQMAGTALAPITLSDALNTADGVVGADALTSSASIVKIEHNYIYSDQNQKHVGLFVANGNEYKINGLTNSNGTGTGYKLEVSRYLYLNGVLNLEGESQLVQGGESILDQNSGGYLERDQQGTANSFNYNYWTSSVGAITPGGLPTFTPSTNGTFKIKNVLFNGTDPNNPVATTYNASAYAADAGLGVISSYWLYQFYGKDDDYNSWFPKITETSVLAPGVGYTMKGSLGNKDIKNDFQNYVFRGKPYNGDIELELFKTHITPSGDVDRLIGNPYPSALDANEFIKDNINTSIDGNAGRNSVNVFNGAIYFWDHFGEENTHILRSYIGGYATYTLMGGVKAQSTDWRINHDNSYGDKVPGQYIPVNQGFFVLTGIDPGIVGTLPSVDGGTIIFKNSQRFFQKESYETGSSVFMKAEKGKTTVASKTSLNIDVRQKIRLMFDSPKGFHRQLLIGVDNNTTNNFDLGYDGLIADIGPEDMYWTAQGAKLVIQGVPNFNKDQEFPLVLKIAQTGLARIKIDGLENVDNSTDIYIKDAFTGKMHQVNNQPFEIMLDPGIYSDRFSLTFALQNTLGDTAQILKEGIVVTINNATSEIQIKNTLQAEITNIALYNSLGQLQQVWETNLEEPSILLAVNNKVTGMYLLKIKTSKGIVAKKVIIE